MTAIYKLADADAWAAACAAGVYAGSALDQADGYIHLSTADQLAETARRHFAGRTGLVLVEIAAQLRGAELKWEASRGGDLFPHLYGPLATADAGPARRLSVDSDGVMQFEDGGVGWP